jgi:hypothetical protein
VSSDSLGRFDSAIRGEDLSCSQQTWTVGHEASGAAAAIGLSVFNGPGIVVPMAAKIFKMDIK